jgi:hypothetical protein
VEVADDVRVWPRHDARSVLVALRVLTPLAVLTVLVADPPWAYGHLPRSAMVGTRGRGLIDWRPTGGAPVVVASLALAVGCLLVIAGRWVRPAATLVVVLGVWVLGVPQIFTWPSHHHHVLWLMLIVALSGGGTDEDPRVDPEWWVRAALLLIGLVYLFPGIAKAELLPEWVTTDNVRNIILQSRAEKGVGYGFVPPAGLAHLMAAGTIAFELTFLFVTQTRFRRPMVAIAIVFHVTTGITAGIWFESLTIILLAFLVAPPQQPDRSRLPSRPAQAVAATLIALVVLTGLGGASRAWPVAHYPAFDYVMEQPTPWRMVARWEGGEAYAGAVILPDAPPARQVKMESAHDEEELAELVEAQVGEPVVVSPERVDGGR